MALTQKQEMFCLAYIETGNASEAYRRAYDAKNMKQETIAKKACGLLAEGNIRGRVEELRGKLEDASIMTAKEALAEASRLARFDIRRLYRPDGSPIPIHELDDDTAHCIAAVDIQEEYIGSGEDRVFSGYTKKYKVADKNGALDKLFKHHGLYEKDREQEKAVVNVTVDTGAVMAAIEAKLAKLG